MAEEDSRSFAVLYERFVKLQQPFSEVISGDISDSVTSDQLCQVKFVHRPEF
jgi:hypothetical protein